MRPKNCISNASTRNNVQLQKRNNKISWHNKVSMNGKKWTKKKNEICAEISKRTLNTKQLTPAFNFSDWKNWNPYFVRYNIRWPMTKLQTSQRFMRAMVKAAKNAVFIFNHSQILIMQSICRLQVLLTWNTKTTENFKLKNKNKIKLKWKKMSEKLEANTQCIWCAWLCKKCIKGQHDIH